MTGLEEIVTKDRVILDHKGVSKRQLLQSLAEIAAKTTGIDGEVILGCLAAREKLGTTGLGSGIAIPHAKIAGLPKLIGFFIRLAKPVDFDAVDGEPVDLVLLLLAPDDSAADHLKALARIARILREPEVCKTLRQAKTVDQIHTVLAGRTEPPRP